MSKLLLCRPRGGLNDTLCQMDVCFEYAAVTGRKLWVDTNRSGFLDCFSKYFDAVDGINFGCPVYFSGSTYPHVENLDYQSLFDSNLKNFVLSEAKVPLTFSLNQRYQEDLLIHEQCGSGLRSLKMFRRLKLRPNLAGWVLGEVASLGSYDAVHVRNTDYKTDYREFFRKIELADGRTLVLCTDDARCQEYARDVWGGRVICNQRIPDTSGKSLHMNPDLERWDTNLQAIRDLIVLAASKKLHIHATEGGVYSGYSALAYASNKNKDDLCFFLGL